MEKMKQISVKIDPETLKAIDELVLRVKWYKRNAIINGILTAVIDACKDDDVYRMLRYWRHDSTTLPRITVSDGRSL